MSLVDDFIGRPWRAGLAAILIALAPVVPMAAETEGAVAVYRASEDFDSVKEAIALAITDRGMLVSGELHVSEMLNRTGVDLGFPNAVYVRAESVEFCSALMSHKMTQVDASNLVICPFTIAVYITAAEPGQVYVAYRRQRLAGAAAAVEAELHGMLHGIVTEALGL